MSSYTAHLELTKQIAIDDINIDYAADDSCQIQCWARGHIEPAAFLAACESRLLAWDERKMSLEGRPVSHKVWRTVRAPREMAEMGVCEYIHVEARPGASGKIARGAYRVTVLNEWLPLHRKD